MLLRQPRMADHASSLRMKNAPARAGDGVEAVHDDITRMIITMPALAR